MPPYPPDYMPPKPLGPEIVPRHQRLHPTQIIDLQVLLEIGNFYLFLDDFGWRLALEIFGFCL
jgi:hypothetical protein